MNPFQQAFNFLTGNKPVVSPLPAGQQLTPKQIYDAHYAQQVKANGGYVDNQGITHYNASRSQNNVQNPIQGAMTKVVQAVLPPPQVANAQQVNATVTPNITIPYSQGGAYTLPAQLAQPILNAFNKNNEATNAAQVLNHQADDPYLPGDPRSIDHNTYGENASFKENNIDVINRDKNGTPYMVNNPSSGQSEPSMDRGLFRVNNGTFYGYMSNPVSKAALSKMGITSYADMNDPQKNADFAALLQQNAGWGRWFAAPKQLRSGNYTPGQPLTMYPKNN